MSRRLYPFPSGVGNVPGDGMQQNTAGAMGSRPAAHGTLNYSEETCLGLARVYQPPSSCNALCGMTLACASTVVPALTRIWLRVKDMVSRATSASRITLSA